MKRNPSLYRRLAAARAALSKPLEWGLILAMAFLVFDVLWGVFSRYVLNAQAVWTEELAIYLLIWISLLGGALVYGERGHLGVDYLTEKLDPSARKLAAIGVELVAFAFSAFAFAYGGWVLMSETLASGQTSPALGWQMGYVYAAAPLCGIFICAYAVEHILEICAGGDDESAQPVEKGI